MFSIPDLVQDSTNPAFAELYRKHGRKKHFSKNSNIINAGDNVRTSYMITKGMCAYIHLTRDGASRAFSLLLPGSSFGESPLIMNRPVTVSVICLEYVEVLELSENFIAEYLKHPAYTYEIMHHVADKYRGLYEVLALFTTLNATQRLAIFFKCYASRVQPDKDGWYTIRLKLTHERIAAMISSGRVTVTLLLSHIKDAELITTDGPHIRFSPKIIDSSFIENELSQTKWANIRR